MIIKRRILLTKKKTVSVIICALLSITMVALTACGGGASKDGNKPKATLAGKRDVEGSGTEAEAEDDNDNASSGSIYGEYDAVAASVNGDDEVWIEEGEYLIVNEDDTISMHVADQDLDFDTEINDNKFYINGNTRVGEINSDGSITLNLSDETQYIFAKEGSSKWKEWRSAMGEDDEAEETEEAAESVTGTDGASMNDKIGGMLD
ncbi:MAG: hypothetical protein K5857_00120, partial [Lachnospiraceae bacterium]|nr:hypothetical protein [Lachnospiraceae bacterium]